MNGILNIANIWSHRINNGKCLSWTNGSMSRNYSIYKANKQFGIANKLVIHKKNLHEEQM